MGFLEAPVKATVQYHNLERLRLYCENSGKAKAKGEGWGLNHREEVLKNEKEDLPESYKRIILIKKRTGKWQLKLNYT
jgi:hypothetical protein